MDEKSEGESSLYTDIVKNLSNLMSDAKLEEKDEVSENASSKSLETNDGDQGTTPKQVKHEKCQLEFQRQFHAYPPLQLQTTWLLQNPQMQFLNMHAYIQQFTAINQLYLLQNQQQLKNRSLYVWSGPLPIKNDVDAVYSKKVFFGGIPWVFDDKDVKNMLKDFGPLIIEWPMDENHHRIKGYTYVIFESEQQVSSLLDDCKAKGNYFPNNSFFFKIEGAGKHKIIELIPWRISDACYIHCSYQNKGSLDVSNTAFIGGIHGKLTADALKAVFDDLFGGVAFIGIDVDEHNYPKGAGRVIFNNKNSYMRAVAARFIEIKSGKIQKRIQIDPFVQDSLCASCGFQRGKYFCRDTNCFNYFCSQCWTIRHSISINFQGHTPLTRNSNLQQQYYAKSNENNKTGINNSGKKKSGWIRKTKK